MDANKFKIQNYSVSNIDPRLRLTVDYEEDFILVKNIYENLYHNAVPVLKKYNLPATFFISTGFVDDLKGVGRPFPTNRFYWTDFIDYFVNYSNEEKAKLDVYGKEYNLKNDEGKIHFVEDTKEYLKNCSPKKRDEFINMFKREFEAFGFDMDYDYPDIQNLSWEQIKEIDENPLFDIGGHTHNHEIMSYLSDAELASEIGTCLEQLEKKYGKLRKPRVKVESFIKDTPVIKKEKPFTSIATLFFCILSLFNSSFKLVPLFIS